MFLKSVDERESNRVILVNLKDISTGAALRKERRIREAERSADQFAAALFELLRLPDTDPLQSFLTYCDIPLAGHSRLRGIVREPLTLAEMQHSLRSLGARNLRDYGTLHDAAIGFCERHTARLRRHARNPSLESVPSCMHVVRSVAGVLATQIERLLIGLSSVECLTNDEWYGDRVKLDQMLGQWIALLRVVHTEWLIALLEFYKRDEIKEAVHPDIEPLRELTSLFNNVRGRVVETMKHFRVQTPNGNRVEPPVMEDNTIHQSTWTGWSEEVRVHQLALETLVTLAG